MLQPRRSQRRTDASNGKCNAEGCRSVVQYVAGVRGFHGEGKPKQDEEHRATVRGHRNRDDFYSVFQDHAGWQCRSTLELVAQDRSHSAGVLLSQTAL